MAASFWRRTPPALFPATLGMLGLSLGWRSAVEVIDAPDAVWRLLLAATGLFFVFAFGAYIAKAMRRPSVVLEDMNPVPGRAAVSAGSMCLLLLAAGLAALGAPVGLAQGVWLAGLGLHVAYMLCVIAVLTRAPAEARVVTPVLFLPFVGYIVSPIGGVPLGYGDLANWLYLYSLVAGAVIITLSAPRFVLRPTPIPARASAAILLAPTSIGAVSGHALGYGGLVAAFIGASLIIALTLLARLRWLTAGGFTPLWGAFTFPSAAFASAMMVAAARWGGAWEWAAALALVAATVIIAPIWVMTIRAWSLGRLAPATGAGTV